MIDRDKILVPSNWDSWGKIRIIREGFDMEGVSTAWSIEIQDPPEPLVSSSVDDDKPQCESLAGLDDGTSTVTVFEQTIKDPKLNTSMTHPGSQQSKSRVEVETSDMQGFLTKQLEILEKLKLEDEKDRVAKQVPQLEMSPLDDSGQVNEHIGPVQFNMGGIQVDADDMLRKLKVSDDLTDKPFPSPAIDSLTILPIMQEREANRSQRKDTLLAPTGEKSHNQALANFFAGLVKKPGGSPRGSPSA
jgi:dynein light intermediate chain 1